MIVDVKYHIFTIAAIFAALGLGILIGTSLIGKDTLMEEQERLISDIARDIEQVRDENKELVIEVNNLEDRLSYTGALEEELFGLIIDNNILTNNYKIFASADYSEYNIDQLKYIKNMKKPDKFESNDLRETSEIIFWYIKEKEECDYLREWEQAGYEDINIMYHNSLLGLLKFLLERELNEKNSNGDNTGL